jgi:DNA-binding FadR family transcriptional regulator
MVDSLNVDEGQRSMSLIFRPIQGGNTFEQTVERLLQSMKLGVVGPGEQLPVERELALSLGISRVTLREAIRSLQEAGYLESRRGRNGGTFVVRRPLSSTADGKRVRKLDPDEVADILGFRSVVEVAACELAARRGLSPEEAAQLRKLEAECSSASVKDYRPADSRLHLAIAEFCGIPSLVTSVAEVRIRLNEVLDVLPLFPANIEHSNRQHVRLINKIIRGNADGAKVEMCRHLDGTAALLHAFLP